MVLSLLSLLLIGVGGCNFVNEIDGFVVQRVDKSDSFGLRINQFVNFTACVSELIWNPELHQQVLTHDEDFE
jgi:hypothetical protein